PIHAIYWLEITSVIMRITKTCLMLNPLNWTARLEITINFGMTAIIYHTLIRYRRLASLLTGFRTGMSSRAMFSTFSMLCLTRTKNTYFYTMASTFTCTIGNPLIFVKA